MKLIVGLGNPGEKYEHTRHNLGFVVLDHLLKDNTPVKKSIWSKNEKVKSETAEILVNDEKIILAKPHTYMNNSGLAVGALASFYKIDPSDIWTVHDELDLPLGTMKIRIGGSSAGHNGIESVMQHLKTEKFWRFRLGIGVVRNRGELAKQKIHDVEDFVLDRFHRGEAGKVRELVKRATHALTAALEDGIESAQNRFNTK